MKESNLWASRQGDFSRIFVWTEWHYRQQSAQESGHQGREIQLSPFLNMGQFLQERKAPCGFESASPKPLEGQGVDGRARPPPAAGACTRPSRLTQPSSRPCSDQLAELPSLRLSQQRPPPDTSFSLLAPLRAPCALKGSLLHELSLAHAQPLSFLPGRGPLAISHYVKTPLWICQYQPSLHLCWKAVQSISSSRNSNIFIWPLEDSRLAGWCCNPQDINKFCFTGKMVT